VRRGSYLLPCLADEGEPEFGVAAVEFERGQAAEHVPGEQVVPGLAGSADRHAVVGPRAADVVHVGVQPGGESCRLAGGGGHVCGVRRLAGPREHAVGHLHVGGHAARQLAGGRGGVQPALRACDRCQGGGRRLVDDRPCGQGHKRQRHCLAEVSPFRWIVTSRITEPDEVYWYPDPARYSPDLVYGECLLPPKHVRDPALRVPHRQGQLLLRPAVRLPDLLQQRREVAAREGCGDGRRGPELWR
jgi:hypothetical protein